MRNRLGRPRPSLQPLGADAVTTRPDALIFDLDGTLWDAAAASTYGWNLALEEMGLAQRVTDAGIRSVSGKPFPECVSTLLPELAPWPPELQEHLEVRERTGIELIAGELYPGVDEGLRRLAARYPLFLVSDCPTWCLEEFFRHSGLRDLFTGWDCWGLSGIPKPGMLLNLAERYHLGRAVYVGDTKGAGPRPRPPAWSSRSLSTGSEIWKTYACRLPRSRGWWRTSWTGCSAGEPSLEGFGGPVHRGPETVRGSSAIRARRRARRGDRETDFPGG